MPESSLMRPGELNVNDIKFSEPKLLGDKGARQVLLSVGTAQLCLHTPKMRLPFGLSCYEEPGKDPKYELNLAFDNMDSNPGIKEFHDKIKEFDACIKKNAMKHCQQWLKKKDISEEVIDEFFTDSVKYSKNKETGELNTQYSPTFKVKVPYYSGNFACEVFDHERKQLKDDIKEVIQRGHRVTAIIKCTGIWISASRFGCSWKLQQLKLDPFVDMKSFMFRDEDEDVPL